MSDAPERIALRWTEGAAITSGPLMDHPEYTRYVRADRIEELEAENKRLRLEAAHANDTADAAIHRTKELEAKLAKAVEALEVLSNEENLDNSCGYYDGGCTILNYQARQRYGDFDDVARTTLAELKGQDDDD